MFPEYWDPMQYATIKPDSMTIKKPYLNFASKVSFKFEDYNANLQMQCAQWMKMSMTCLNLYGEKARMHQSCDEVFLYLDQCVRINTTIARHKKYFPEEYVYSKDARIDPHYNNVYLPGDTFK